MGEELNELYQSIILDHNNRPRNYGILESFTHSKEGYNPLCGDKVSVFLTLDEGRIQKIGFEVASCAICKASASIMTELLDGKLIQEAEKMHNYIREILSANSNLEVDLSIDGELAVFAGVRKFPARVKCALLPWDTVMSIEY